MQPAGPENTKAGAEEPRRPVAQPQQLLGFHSLQGVAQTKHRRIQEPPRIVPERAHVRELREQLQDGMDLRRRRFHDHAPVESTAALDVNRNALHPPIWPAPPAIRNGHETSQVRSLFSSASKSPLPAAAPC